ncbi:MAG: hypothetical protein KY445_03205 [Armatimonadetes bacterium]|nr:hypothetical protein [Armatimonadota bacterium]
MKIRVTIHLDPIHIDEILEGATEDDLFRKFREEAASRAPFFIKMALKTMSDQTIREKVVESYNHKFKAREPVPANAKEFIAFGERVGFVTRVST